MPCRLAFILGMLPSKLDSQVYLLLRDKWVWSGYMSDLHGHCMNRFIGSFANVPTFDPDWPLTSFHWHWQCLKSLKKTIRENSPFLWSNCRVSLFIHYWHQFMTAHMFLCPFHMWHSTQQQREKHVLSVSIRRDPLLLTLASLYEFSHLHPRLVLCFQIITPWCSLW